MKMVTFIEVREFYPKLGKDSVSLPMQMKGRYTLDSGEIIFIIRRED